MKIKSIVTVFCVLLTSTLNAQHYEGLDTIPGRYKDFYYPEWYDECPGFCTDSAKFTPFCSMVGYGTIIRENYTPRPLTVKGVAVMVARDELDGPRTPLDTTRLPEYVFLYQRDHSQPDSLLFVDSARWDTVVPKVMRLPTICDSATQVDTVRFPIVRYCYVHECRFDKPHIVDSTFYIGGTNNSNGLVFDDTDSVMDYRPAHLRITYYAIHPNDASACQMHLKGRYWRRDTLTPWEYQPMHRLENPFGQFLAIVDNHYLNVYTSDSTMGTVTGSGLFPDQSYDTISAIPNPGYAFLRWNDGSTANPRVVCLNHDTSFTAYFREDRDFFVQLASNNDDWGTVTGQGYYSANSTATIKATPNSGYIFDRWSDGNLLSTRSITVTQDTTLTAYFYVDSSMLDIAKPSEDGPCVTLQPNPAGSHVEIKADSYGEYTVELLNANGGVELQAAFSGTKTSLDLSALPSGTYIVRIATTAGTAYKKLVVK